MVAFTGVPKSIAIDTETTGTYLRSGCKAYMVTACDNEGKTWMWEFAVNPETREPIYTTTDAKKKLREIQSVFCRYRYWVFHNGLFDLKALEDLPFPRNGWKRKSFDDFINSIVIEDTMLMAHCYDSLDKLGLKGLSIRYLDYPDDDEKELGDIAKYCRRIGKKLGWCIAERDNHPSLRGMPKSSGDDEETKKWKYDMWLPAEVAKRRPDLIDIKRFSVKQVRNACSRYGTGDVVRTMALYMYYSKFLIEKDEHKHYLRNRACILPTHYMQNEGLPIHMDRLPGIIEELTETKEEVRKGLQRLCRIKDFNPRSYIQLQKAMFEKMGFDPIKFSDSGNPSTDKDTLKDFLSQDDLSREQTMFCRRLLTYRQLNSAETYLDSYERHQHRGLLFTNLNPTGTTTTRYSHKNPNAGNISKQGANEDSLDLTVNFNLRAAFGPTNGRLWICIDYSQLQLRIFAHACDDGFLIDSFSKGLDIHDTVAREVFGTDKPTDLQRRAAKTINFGIIFGAGRARIERMSGMPGAFDMFKDRFPLVDSYLKQCERDVRRCGFVRTLGGYPLRVQRANAYKGCNFVVQGTEGEMIKQALTECHYYCQDESVIMKPIMMIHDEIIFQTTKKITPRAFLNKHYDSLQGVASIMNHAGDCNNVKTEVDCKIVSTVWSEGKALKEYGTKYSDSLNTAV